MKIVTVVGARPQFVKAGPVSRALQEHGITEWMIHTGQHYDHSLSQVFFDELGMTPPRVNLGVGSGSHAEQTASILVGMERAIIELDPDWVLVYGDTNSTLAGALAAAKLHVPVAHVEAGLRSGNRRMPEEINRVVTDTISSLLFAPTEASRHNLIQEGISSDIVHLVGDVMYDAALLHSARADQQSRILQTLGIARGDFILVTVHRAENTDDDVRLSTIVNSLLCIARERQVVWPIHPRTRAALLRAGLLARTEERLRLIDPVGYLDMVMLEKAACVIATDSGGVQKEAFFHRVPCVTLREETEWVETVEMGWNRLAPPTDAGSVADAIRDAIGVAGSSGDPYGGGCSAARIAAILAGS